MAITSLGRFKREEGLKRGSKFWILKGIERDKTSSLFEIFAWQELVPASNNYNVLVTRCNVPHWMWSLKMTNTSKRETFFVWIDDMVTSDRPSKYRQIQGSGFSYLQPLLASKHHRQLWQTFFYRLAPSSLGNLLGMATRSGPRLDGNSDCCHF